MEILCKLINSIPPRGRLTNNSYKWKLDNLIASRGETLRQNYPSKFLDFAKRMRLEYEAILKSVSKEETIRLIEKREAKNKKIQKKNYEQNFSKNEFDVVNAFAELALRTGTDDNLKSLKVLVNIMTSDLLDQLVQFRKDHRKLVKYLDGNRLAEACKLSVAKKAMDA
jgi:hypothetical protein